MNVVTFKLIILLLTIAIGIKSEGELGKEYDYVIVGSGSAGAVIANRLSQNPDHEILLLEAGGSPNLITEIPDLLGHLQRSEYDWGYKTVPQKDSCWGLEEQRSLWSQGKALGGSSTINALMYVRGNKMDYDQWAENGAYGWSYEEVLPYFKKSEDCVIPSLKNNGYHGIGGELIVDYPKWKTSLTETYLKAGAELGYHSGDYNGAFQRVFSPLQINVRDGKRCSTAKAFLEPILKRKNLHIFTSAFVRKINFDDNKRANKVIFDYKNETILVEVRREIILSAGAIKSPQILMLSGIGPKEHLEEIGIPVISDLPVGKNLQDHVSTVAMIFTIDKSHRMVPSNVDNIEMYSKEKGVLSSTGGVEAIGFINTKYNNKLDWPDIELMMISVSLASDGNTVFKQNTGVNDEVYNKYILPYTKNATISCLPMLLRPKSRGEITLKSMDPYEYPIIDPKYFSHPDDLKVLTEGMKMCLDLASTSSMKERKTKPLDTIIPGCEKYEKLSEQYLACAAQTMTFTVYHPLGTCKMGSVSDKTAVVSPSLKVKGVRGLRIADASIMPTTISGHNNAPAIMIGEKAADLILKEFKDRLKKYEL